MAKYAVEAARTLITTANNTVGSVVADTGGSALRRLKFYFISFGFSTTPADAALVLTARRCTAEGTNTDVVPVALDPGDGASLSDAGENHSADPTYTASSEVLSFGIHQRACPLLWYAPPGGEIVTPATASNGLGFETTIISTGTPDGYLMIHFEE